MSEEEKILLEIQELETEITKLDVQRKEIIIKIQELKGNADKLKDKLYLLKSKKVSQVQWAEKSCDWNDKIKQILNDTFKLQTFRHQQLAAINAFLSKCDVILLMPTGGGKSLCYQLPALTTDGVTLVISPLLSLIDDQIISLKKWNIPCVAINSSTSKEVTKKVHENLAHGAIKYKLIYVTPEWIAKSKRFMSYLQKCYERKKLDRIAIDEVHCCSQWGHDFRPDYKYLQILKKIFPDVPIMGVTATATESILVDVQKILRLEGCLILKSSYNRPNLFYEVRQKPSDREEFIKSLTDMIKVQYAKLSGIIYTNTISDTVDLAIALKDRGVAVACYHANMTPEQRHKIHKKWLENHYQVVVATVAFGMGIDKADVRFVIHHTIPKSMANFYQESGRAGRDDQKSDCIIFYSSKDVFKLNAMISALKSGTENLYQIAQYCLDVKGCRRLTIASHFNDVWDETDCNKMCDNCVKPNYYKTIDISPYYRNVCRIIEYAKVNGNRLTLNKLLISWLQCSGTKVKKLLDLRKPFISKELGENIVIHLVMNNFLKEDFHFTAYNTVTYIARENKTYDSTILMDVSLDVPYIASIPEYVPKVKPVPDKTKQHKSSEVTKTETNNVDQNGSSKVEQNDSKPKQPFESQPSTSGIKRKASHTSDKNDTKKMKKEKVGNGEESKEEKKTEN